MYVVSARFLAARIGALGTHAQNLTDQTGTAEQNKGTRPSAWTYGSKIGRNKPKKKSKSAHQMVHICIRSEKERKGNMNASRMHPRSRRKQI